MVASSPAWRRSSADVLTRPSIARRVGASLAKLVRYLEKHGGYMSAGNQAALREAKSLLAEHVEDEQEGATQ